MSPKTCSAPPRGGRGKARRLTKPSCVIATVESDAHSWNLVYLHLKMREAGFHVWNLGCCTPPSLVFDTIAACSPSLVIISSVNGHGFFEGRGLIRAARERERLPPFLIGGKLTTKEGDFDLVGEELLAEGYAGVFIGPEAMALFDGFLAKFEDPSLDLRRVA